jgi:glycosyltransferase involved in cell wall biosynthesis
MDCTVIGEGPERGALELLSRRLGVADRVGFTGGLGLEHVMMYLENADALVLVSETEGWPKALVEGMAFGLACVGSDRGLVPKILKNRGLVVPVRDADRLSECLSQIYSHPDRYQRMRREAAQWAQQFSIPALRDSIRRLLEQRWQVKLSGAPRATVAEIVCPLG